MSRIFLDVGSHHGQTIEMMLQPRFKIDKIVGFDPSPLCHSILEAKFSNNTKVTIVKTGLWSNTCEMDLHNEGSQGGTVHADYQTTCNPEPRITRCKFIKASDWFKDNVSAEDEIFLKLNCEGSECRIIMDLLESGEYSKIKATLVDFDVRKSPSAKGQESELRQKMKTSGISNLHIYMGPNRNIILQSVLGQKGKQK
jgi:FkbM family methyltransferase